MTSLSLGKWIRNTADHRFKPFCFCILHIFSLYLFTQGFLLTKVYSPERNQSTRVAAVKHKLVWLVIDGLRYDAVISDDRYSCKTLNQGHCGQLQYIERLLQQDYVQKLFNVIELLECIHSVQDQVARAFRFIADPPAATTQRVRCLTTGGLPSFFDVGNTFTPGHVAEDNLIDQLYASGKKLALLGDVTWSQLFPTQFQISHTYPSFNVKDLHTVDDGISKHLPALLLAPGSWDVLVAHYLGVDHVGHTHGGESEEMIAKLQQMDSRIEQVVEEMVLLAGPNGEYEKTILLIAGDHGQTLLGAHGGGSPEEVDSALVAVNLAALHRSRDVDSKKGVKELSRVWGTAACKSNCTCGPDANQCAADMPQLDLAPTLASLLGVPIPSGNLGKICPELWGLFAADSLEASVANDTTENQKAANGHACGREAVDALLTESLKENVDQVHSYLNKGTSHTANKLGGSALRRINELYEELSSINKHAGVDESELQHVRYLRFLDSAGAFARTQWTEFGDFAMIAGLLLLASTLGLHGAAAFTVAEPAGKIDREQKGVCSTFWKSLQSMGLLPKKGHRANIPTVAGVFVLLVATHALGIFSFFFLLSEGSKISIIVAAMFVTIFMSALPTSAALTSTKEGLSFSQRPFTAKRTSRQLCWRHFMLALLALGSNAGMAAAGLASHSGNAFWYFHTTDPELLDAARDPTDLTDMSGVAQALSLPNMIEVPVQLLLSTLHKHFSQVEQAWCSLAQHILLCTLPIALLAAAFMQRVLWRCRCQKLRPPAMQLALLVMAFMSGAAYHHLEHLQQLKLIAKDCSIVHLMQPVAARSWQLYTQSLLSVYVREVAQVMRVDRLPFLPMRDSLLALGGYLVEMPLRLLLPQVTYTLVGMSAILFVAAHACKCLVDSCVGKTRSSCGKGNAAAMEVDTRLSSVAYVCDWLQGLLLALVLQVSGTNMPLLLCLGVVQLWAGTQMLCLRAQKLQTRADRVAKEAAALLAMVQMQMFFCTGQLCEFAGLQHLAGFVGYDEFHLFRSGILLVIHTFAPMLMIALLLPCVLESLARSDRLQNSSEHRKPSMASEKSEQCKEEAAPAWHQAVLVFQFIRCCTAFAATLSAGIQRRHVFVWALFAPRFSFEVCFLLGTDLILGLVAAFG